MSALGLRAVEALGRGFLHRENTALLRWLQEREPHAQDYYRQLLRVVSRLLFLFMAEDRGLLSGREISEADLSDASASGLTELGGLFDPAGTLNLNGCVVGNADLLAAIRALSDYRNLGSEKLGSVYESLLELRPRFTVEPPSFLLETAAGNERKTTGSYYTPTSLIDCLLDSALDPVLAEAAGKPEPERAILDLKVCDPACGSGHFLIAAARRIGRRLAAVRTHEEEPAPDAVRHAVRDVIGRCVYGVDVNPMAVELCRAALWLEAMEPGRPLTFLQHRIQCGNALLGATPALLRKDTSDADLWCAAFVSRKAKDSREVARLREQYQFFHWHLAFPEVFRPAAKHETADNELTGWCGGFDVVLGNPPWEHTEIKDKEWFAAHGRQDIADAPNEAARVRMIQALATENPTLHAEYTQELRKADGVSQFVRNTGRYPLCGRGRINTYAVFAELSRNLIGPTGRVGCVVPSGIATDDTTKFFFQDLIDKQSLVSLFDFENREAIFPGVHRSYKFALLTLTGGRCELADLLFFAGRLADLADPAKRFTLRAGDFALLSPNSRNCPVFRTAADAELTKAIYRRVPVLVREQPEANPWGISFKQGLFNMASDSGLFRTARQLVGEGWHLDGNVFRKGDAAYLPLYEAKLLHHFDHRWATYDGTASRDVSAEEKGDPDRLTMPRYWVPTAEVSQRLGERWKRKWLLGWRNVCRNTDVRTMIAQFLPLAGVGHSHPLMSFESASVGAVCGFSACVSSFVLDYCVRQKLGGANLTFGFVRQLPVLPPSTYAAPCPWSPTDTLAEWLLPRVVELTYTAWDLRPFAADCGFDGPPSRWDEPRRFRLRCELDAAFFRLYLGRGDWQQVHGEPDEDFARLVEAFPSPRHAVAHIMDTFPIVREKDAQHHGRYRTKERILEVYDALTKSEM